MNPDNNHVEGLSRWVVARILLYGLFVICVGVLFRSPLESLLTLSLDDERYSYILLILPIAIGLAALRRHAIFSSPQFCPAAGLPLLAVGILLALKPGQNAWQSTTAICGIAIICIGGFTLLFGSRATSAACFPLGILLLIVPAPSPVLDHVTAFLQQASAYTSGLLFNVIRVPAFRQGVIISLPGFDIEVAQQCSGIRSSLALVLASTVASWVLLRFAWNRIAVVLITIPVVIFKNAVRIVTLSSLALYVNQGFLHGRLHRYGGLPFSLIDLAIVVPLLLQLRKLESASLTKTQVALAGR